MPSVAELSWVVLGWWSGDSPLPLPVPPLVALASASSLVALAALSLDAWRARTAASHGDAPAAERVLLPVFAPLLRVLASVLAGALFMSCGVFVCALLTPFGASRVLQTALNALAVWLFEFSSAGAALTLAQATLSERAALRAAAPAAALALTVAGATLAVSIACWSVPVPFAPRAALAGVQALVGALYVALLVSSMSLRLPSSAPLSQRRRRYGWGCCGFPVSSPPRVVRPAVRPIAWAGFAVHTLAAAGLLALSASPGPVTLPLVVALCAFAVVGTPLALCAALYADTQYWRGRLRAPGAPPLSAKARAAAARAGTTSPYLDAASQCVRSLQLALCGCDRAPSSQGLRLLPSPQSRHSSAHSQMRESSSGSLSRSRHRSRSRSRSFISGGGGHREVGMLRDRGSSKVGGELRGRPPTGGSFGAGGNSSSDSASSDTSSMSDSGSSGNSIGASSRSLRGSSASRQRSQAPPPFTRTGTTHLFGANSSSSATAPLLPVLTSSPHLVRPRFFTRGRSYGTLAPAMGTVGAAASTVSTQTFSPAVRGDAPPRSLLSTAKRLTRSLRAWAADASTLRDSDDAGLLPLLMELLDDAADAGALIDFSSLAVSKVVDHGGETAVFRSTVAGLPRPQVCAAIVAASGGGTGSGSWGSLQPGKPPRTLQRCAVKVFKPFGGLGSSALQRIASEVRAMLALQTGREAADAYLTVWSAIAAGTQADAPALGGSPALAPEAHLPPPTLVRFLGCCYCPPDLSILTEWCSRGTLRTWLDAAVRASELLRSRLRSGHRASGLRRRKGNAEPGQQSRRGSAAAIDSSSCTSSSDSERVGEPAKVATTPRLPRLADAHSGVGACAKLTPPGGPYLPVRFVPVPSDDLSASVNLPNAACAARVLGDLDPAFSQLITRGRVALALVSAEHLGIDLLADGVVPTPPPIRVSAAGTRCVAAIDELLCHTIWVVGGTRDDVSAMPMSDPEAWPVTDVFEFDLCWQWRQEVPDSQGFINAGGGSPAVGVVDPKSSSSMPRRLSSGAFQRLCFALDAASAVAFLHAFSPELVHRDIKSPNFFLSPAPRVRGDSRSDRSARVRASPSAPPLSAPGVPQLFTAPLVAKLGDLGDCRRIACSAGPFPAGFDAPSGRSPAGRSFLEREMTREVGTSQWQAPEVVLPDYESGTLVDAHLRTACRGNDAATDGPRDHRTDGRVVYDHRADVYSLALVLWELATGATPYAGLQKMALRTAALQHCARPPLPARVPRAFAHLVRTAWHPDPAARPPAVVIARVLARLLAAARTGTVEE